MNITVAIPIYNEEKTILKTLLSFDHKNFLKKTTFVLIDNNSTDNSRKIIKKFQKRNPRFKIIYGHEKKQGIKCARKTALETSLKLNPQIMVTTDADIAFNAQVLKEILSFAKNKNADVFVGRSTIFGTIPPKQQILRLAYFRDFISLSIALWNLEEKIFGKYFFTICCAIKTNFYKKVAPFFDIENSLTITERNDDLFLSRLCYYLNGSFIYSKSKVIASPRRIFADPIGWLTKSGHGNYRQTRFKFTKKTLTYFKKNKSTLIRKRLEKEIENWFRYFIDALSFWKITKKQHRKASSAIKRFLKFFRIPQKEVENRKLYKSPLSLYQYLYKKYSLSSLEILKEFINKNEVI